MTSQQKFKELIYRMYENFPNSRIQAEEVRKVIVSIVDRQYFERHGYLLSETENYYGLGPNSLLLINAWETDKLNKKILIFTILSAIIAFLALFISLIK